MANNPYMDDKTILNESSYLKELKGMTERIDQAARRILEKQKIQVEKEKSKKK